MDYMDVAPTVLGKTVKFHGARTPEVFHVKPALLEELQEHRGMVELQELPGLFAPYLFEVVEG